MILRIVLTKLVIDCLGISYISGDVNPRIVLTNLVIDCLGNPTNILGYKSKDCAPYGYRLPWLSTLLGYKSRDCVHYGHRLLWLSTL